MKKLVQFSIPVSGLENGLHTYRFDIKDDFFSHFENSPIQEGKFSVGLEFDKRPDMYVLDFDVVGTIKSPCDRCLTEIDLPIAGKQQLLVKFSDEENTIDEIIYIPFGAETFDVSQYVFECIILALPIIKVYDCEEDENPPCDEKMLEYLNLDQDTKDPEDKDPNDIWGALKDFDAPN